MPIIPALWKKRQEDQELKFIPQIYRMLNIKNSLNYKRKKLNPSPQREVNITLSELEASTSVAALIKAWFYLSVSSHSLAITLLQTCHCEN